MARKKDPEIRENVDRGLENEQGAAGMDEKDNRYNRDDTCPSDTIKNANASGLGTIGRNDRKQTGNTFHPSADAGKDDHLCPEE